MNANAAVQPLDIPSVETTPDYDAAKQYGRYSRRQNDINE
jgi:hypothetical protein